MSKENLGAAACSFDVTHFGDNWEKFTAEMGLSYVGRGPEGSFVWMSRQLVVETWNNPTTGEYHAPEHRSPEKGFCSYIGAYGSQKQIDRLLHFVPVYAEYVKKINPIARGFA